MMAEMPNSYNIIILEWYRTNLFFKQIPHVKGYMVIIFPSNQISVQLLLITTNKTQNQELID